MPFSVDEFGEVKLNVIGDEDVPLAVKVPLTVNDAPEVKLIVDPD